MEITNLHNWPKNQQEAIEIQEQLRLKVIHENQLESVKYVAGVDVSYNSKKNTAKAAVALLSFPDLQLQQKAIIEKEIDFPYLPGFLSFREIPPLLTALETLTLTPNLLLCDGQGIAHPRRFGLACHLGLITNIPSIGVAKTLFIGEHQPVAPQRGSWQPLLDQSEIIGAVLRTQTNINPLYISTGHKISLPTAIDYVLRCTPRYRLPETTRWADHFAKGLKN